ncbi:hypothetical protein GQX74_002281 [Glossina fuscipes]|nr:hypothetical protein GQX74_002281 [Glossina fuscipes]
MTSVDVSDVNWTECRKSYYDLQSELLRTTLSMSSKSPDAPKRNNDGCNDSTPKVSLTKIIHEMASRTVRTPPAGFSPTI